MVKHNASILKYVLDNGTFSNILELGSGQKSTTIIAKYLLERQKGKCLSLEDSKEWCRRTKKTMTNNKYVNIIWSKLIYNGKLIYDYDFKKEKFDFVLIDGPSPYGNMPNLLKRQKDIINDPSLWINPRIKKGFQSIDLLDYIENNITEKTLIMVDARKKAILYYLQRYTDQFDFCGIDYNNTYYNHLLYRPEHLDAHKYPICNATFICTKNSGLVEKIIKKRYIDKLVKYN